MTSLPTTELELARTIATPSQIGVKFGKALFGREWQPYPFLLDMEREICSACLREDTEDWFIVNCPNQVGKTSWAGVLLCIWFLAMFPDKQIIFVSYSDDYSKQYGRKVKKFFEVYGEALFGLKIDPNNDSASDWGFVGHAGGMMSKGIGSQITGRQGDLVLIDDVLRNLKEAASTGIKDDHWTDFWGTIYGRRQPGSVYAVTSTRLASDDLGGRLMDHEDAGGGAVGDEDVEDIHWVRLIYPGLCVVPDDYDGDPDDYRDRLGRRPGQPLQCRFSRDTDTDKKNWWTSARKQLRNDVLFECMVQQNPATGEGGMFPEKKWVKKPRAEWPELYQKARAWDLAATRGDGDYSTGNLMGKDIDGNYYVINVERNQLGTHEGLEKVKAVAQMDGSGVPILIEQEKAGAGKNLVEFYRKALTGFVVEAAMADGSKEVRATGYSTAQQAGRVILPSDPEDAEWVKRYVKEHKAMRGDGRRGPNDDQIDTGAYAFNFLQARGPATVMDPNDPDAVPLEDLLAMDDYLAAMGL